MSTAGSTPHPTSNSSSCLGLSSRLRLSPPGPGEKAWRTARNLIRLGWSLDSESVQHDAEEVDRNEVHAPQSVACGAWCTSLSHVRKPLSKCLLVLAKSRSLTADFPLADAAVHGRSFSLSRSCAETYKHANAASRTFARSADVVAAKLESHRTSCRI